MVILPAGRQAAAFSHRQSSPNTFLLPLSAVAFYDLDRVKAPPSLPNGKIKLYTLAQDGWPKRLLNPEANQPYPFPLETISAE